jgi:DNA-binding MarR family transcriptional regulator
MPEILDEGHLDAWRALLNAHSEVIDLIERDLAREHRVPLRFYDVLTSLAKAPGSRLRLSELADAVVLSRSGLSRLVDRLEEIGLIAREISNEDRRGAFAILTRKGKQALHHAWPVYGKGIQKYFACHLSAKEASILNRLLRRVSQNHPVNRR